MIVKNIQFNLSVYKNIVGTLKLDGALFCTYCVQALDKYEIK